MRIYTTPSNNYDAVNKKYVDDNSGGVSLALRFTNSTYYITLSSASASTSNRLSYNQLRSYMLSGVNLIGIEGTPFFGGPTVASLNLIGVDSDSSPYVAFIEAKGGEQYAGQVITQYVKLTATSATAGMTATNTAGDVTSTVGMTVAQLTAGTDTMVRPVTAKVIHDYIASLDATNVAY